ncbi:DUF2075 domain-containing protein [Corynebacterium breve]|uniref:DUF2075 domain-containing protein n=1 Tax=Corynebacterium breve TaxID=3049799 RepID=A0ABY8VF11_9CORY|nr:DNA/RNA helicase domain-containing protein [Corynebacterium breve]WIM68236.1 DUF2075 domain-containing protein [Corynebacterium breve]
MEIIGSARTLVEAFSYSPNSLAKFIANTGEANEEAKRLLLKFPTVYIIYYRANTGYSVYVGETNNIAQRTKTHLESDTRLRDLSEDDLEQGLQLPAEPTPEMLQSSKWKAFRDEDSTIIVIGHSLFNKSLTLDIEDRLMLYLSSVDEVQAAGENSVRIQNSRRNIQTEYFTQQYVNRTFQEIWRELRNCDPELFPLERLIQESAIFKASPFHRLNEQQVSAKVEILESIDLALTPKEGFEASQSSKLILVQGGAGTGKTVLLSSVFYELFQTRSDAIDITDFDSYDAYLLVNHDEQLTVYEQIAEKLGLSNAKKERVMKPTRFINSQSPDSPVDIVLIDEAHLLWTQGKQSYKGDHQLKDILQRARVVVAIFDPMQVLAGNQYWQEDALKELYSRAGNDVIHLSEQMRIDSDGPAEEWIATLVNDGIVNPIPTNDKYKVEIFSSPGQLHAKIREKSSSENANEKGLSRLIATYDWKFTTGKKIKPVGSNTWDVVIGNFRLPWNNQGKYSRREKNLAWAERNQTVDEVGSIFTIQGFDLNYAGVIIGPSVKYRNGKIVFDAKESHNPNVIHKRTLTVNGVKKKVDVSEGLLRNQLNVLLTRGVRGLGIYAVDDALREALLNAQQN